MTVHVAPYGSWSSPVAEEHAAHSVFRLGEIQVDGDDVYWTEERPEQGGRVALVRHRDGAATDVGPADFSVRSSVYEYGGGSFLARDGVVFAVSHDDQRIWRFEPGTDGLPITGADPSVRYADLHTDATRRRLLALAERHPAGGGHPVHEVVALPADGSGPPVPLISGPDFLCSHRVSPDGRRLCWIQWSAPNMPWDGSELWVADLDDDGTPYDARPVAGGPSESVLQPQWTPDGVLHFVSDRSGFWNLYRLADGRTEPLAPMTVDFARPQWVLHLLNYTFLPDGRIAAAGVESGRWRLYVIDPAAGTAAALPVPYTDCGSVVRARRDRIVLDAATPWEVRSVVEVDPASAGVTVLARVQGTTEVDRRYFSEPETVVFESEGRPTYAFYYPPCNPDFRAPAGTRPPLLVRAHGGPSSGATAMLDYAVQYWTSRGVAVLDVNYGGSSGYGRAYLRRLSGRWGELDAADCCAGARHMVHRGDVDPDRLIVQGGSAGGLTVLNALARHDVFHLGISYYGIADLEVFAQDTHKFEGHYCEWLVGPYPTSRRTYRDRSPLHTAGSVTRPLLMFQGRDDPVVPAGQARAMFEAVRANGVPCGYLEFDHEQHGFRIDENIHRCTRAELWFAGRVLGFEVPFDQPPVPIENESAIRSAANAGPATTRPR